jgi:hypothetical protein
MQAMGARSRLVLTKLGLGLRTYAEEVLSEPEPDNLKPLMDRLRPNRESGTELRMRRTAEAIS